MTPPSIPRIDLTIRNLQRYQQILNIFLRYGFGHLLDQLNLSSYMDRKKKEPQESRLETERLSFPMRVRLSFEELGPTFIKLGQILSLRSIALPADFVEEMSKLQDDVKKIPYELIREIIEKEIGGAIEEKFKEFNETPLASGSIAQIHQAILPCGSDVVVKVRRPGIKKQIDTDLSILKDLAELIERKIPEIAKYDPSGIVAQLSYTTSRETNLLNEARNIDIFQRNFRDDPTVYIPGVFWDYSSKAVITLERIHGIKISKIGELRNRGFNLKKIASRGAELILQQVFEHGFFHADPHPGNLFILPDNVIALIDFGITGRLDEEMMTQVADALLAVTRKDINGIERFFTEIGSLESDQVDIKQFRIDMADFLDRYTGIPLAKLDMKSMVDDLFSAIERHDVKIRPEYLLLIKSLVVYEDIGRQLDPDFDMVKTAEPYIKVLIWNRFRPRKLQRDMGRIAGNYLELIRHFPVDLRLVLTKLRTGRLNFEFSHKGLDKLILEMEKSSNRISFSLVVGALIIASSFLWTFGSKPLIGGYPVLGIVGYVFAVFLGLWLLVAIVRSGRL